MSKRSGFYPCSAADDAGAKVVSQAGGLLLTETVRVVGLDQELSAALGPWRLPTAVHDPAKVVLDLAVTLGLGGDYLADITLLRTEPGARPGRDRLRPRGRPCAGVPGLYGTWWPRTRRSRARLTDSPKTSWSGACSPASFTRW